MFWWSPSPVEPICYYVQALFNTGTSVAISASNHVNMISSSVSSTIAKQIKGKASGQVCYKTFRRECLASDRLPYGDDYSQQLKFLSRRFRP